MGITASTTAQTANVNNARQQHGKNSSDNSKDLPVLFVPFRWTGAPHVGNVIVEPVHEVADGSLDIVHHFGHVHLARSCIVVNDLVGIPVVVPVFIFSLVVFFLLLLVVVLLLLLSLLFLLLFFFVFLLLLLLFTLRLFLLMLFFLILLFLPFLLMVFILVVFTLLTFFQSSVPESRLCVCSLSSTQGRNRERIHLQGFGLNLERTGRHSCCCCCRQEH
mmetsp:Transcript_10359/g.24680  ORF Transcript_10359/g.24680 Transcript_10359/m.24680 type:complete len:219 (+) Transcript_10359:1358-2014(+)